MGQPGRTATLARISVPVCEPGTSEARGGHRPSAAPYPDEVPAAIARRACCSGPCRRRSARTDLHVTEGGRPARRTIPSSPTPCHEVVGEVARRRPDATRQLAAPVTARAPPAPLTDQPCLSSPAAGNLCPVQPLHRLGLSRRRLRRVHARARRLTSRLPPGYTNDELAPLLCAVIIATAPPALRPPRPCRLASNGLRGSAPGTRGRWPAAHRARAPPRRAVHSFARDSSRPPSATRTSCLPEPLACRESGPPSGPRAARHGRAGPRGTLRSRSIHLTDVPRSTTRSNCSQGGSCASFNLTSTPWQDSRDFLTFAADHKLAGPFTPYPLDAAGPGAPRP